jgi:hypothetical protein
MQTTIHLIAGAQLSGRHVIVPAIGFAQVDQLALDILITTYSMQPIAHLHSPQLVPMLGYDDSGSLVTAAMFYANDALLPGVAVLHIRSMLLRPKLDEFASQLVKELVNHKVAKITVVSGINAAWRNDMQMQGPTLHTVESLSAEPNAAIILESAPLVSALTSCCAQQQLACDTKLMFCAEGFENIGAAAALVQSLPLTSSSGAQTQWKVPAAWDHLFGAAAERSLFT